MTQLTKNMFRDKDIYKNDTPLQQCTWLAAHNAFANPAAGWLYAQQTLSLREQFDYGVRCFLLDVYRQDPPTNKCVMMCWGKVPESYLALKHGRDDHLNVLQKKAKPQSVLSCLRTLATCLKQNQDAIVTLVLEDYAGVWGVQQFTKHLTDLRLHRMCYTQSSSKRSWPTLGWLRRHNRRLIVITSQQSKAVHKSPYMMSTRVLRENHWEWNKGDTVRRASGALALFNHFKSVSLRVPRRFERINSETHLWTRLKAFKRALNMWPTYVAVDHVHEGDAKKVVIKLNQDQIRQQTATSVSEKNSTV